MTSLKSFFVLSVMLFTAIQSAMALGPVPAYFQIHQSTAIDPQPATVQAEPEAAPVAEAAREMTPTGPILSERAVPLGGAGPERLVLMGTHVASPDSAHIAFSQTWGIGYQYVGYGLDDKYFFGAHAMNAPAFTPDSQSVAVVYKERDWMLSYQHKVFPGFAPVSSVRFSPDGQRPVYLARYENKRFVVEGEDPQAMADTVEFDQLVFSSDSSRMAYPAYDGQAWRMVINGDFGPTWDTLATPPTVASAGSDVFFVARKDGQSHVVVNGTPGPGFRFIADNPVLSADGSRFAYWALDNDYRWSVYLNHQHQPAYDAERPGQLILGPDGQTLAAVLKRKGRWLVIYNGQRSPDYQAVGKGSLTLSPDGLSLAYAVKKSRGWAVVVDGKQGQTFTQLLGNSLTFSPDSLSLAYGAQNRGEWSVVVDGKTQEPFNKIDARTLTFSPDSLSIAYVGYRYGQAVVMLNDLTQGEFDEVSPPTFSPNGDHLVFAAYHGRKIFLVADGQPSEQTFDHLVPGANIEFSSDNTCHTVAVRRPGPYFYRIELELASAFTPSPGNDPVSTPTEDSDPDGTPGPQLPEPMSPFVDVPTP